MKCKTGYKKKGNKCVKSTYKKSSKKKNKLLSKFNVYNILIALGLWGGIYYLLDGIIGSDIYLWITAIPSLIYLSVNLLAKKKNVKSLLKSLGIASALILIAFGLLALYISSLFGGGW